MTISASGTARAMPEAKTAAAARDDDPRRRAGQLLEDFEARRSLPGDDRRIVEARHHGGAGLVGDPRGDGFAALGPPVVEDDSAPSARVPRPSPAARRRASR